MLGTISFASAVDTTASTEKKESPLFKIRVQNAIQEKKQIVIERMHNFFVKLISDRIFLRIPLIKRDVDNGPYVLSRGGACTLIKCDQIINQDNDESQGSPRTIGLTLCTPTSCKCSLEKEDALGVDWTNLQPICWKFGN